MTHVLMHEAETQYYSHEHASAGLQFLPCLDRLSVELTGGTTGSLLHRMLQVHGHALYTIVQL